MTEDNRIVFDFFKMVETKGLPIDIALECLQRQNVVPDWISFIENAIKCNWNLKRTLFRLEVAIIDVYGTEYLKCWKQKMNMYLEMKGAQG